jgi:hypothetical protein
MDTRQYAPWSEDDDGEGQPMTEEQCIIAAKRVAAAMASLEACLEGGQNCPETGH